VVAVRDGATHPNEPAFPDAALSASRDLHPVLKRVEVTSTHEDPG